MLNAFKLIKVRVVSDSGNIHIEYINSAHILRFYESDNTITMELINNVKLNVIDINLDLLCERFIA